MKLIQNKYKINNTQKIFKKNFFIFQMGNLSSKKKAVIKQEFNKLDIRISKIGNTLFRTFTKNNGYNNLNDFIQGPLFIGYKKDDDNNLNYFNKVSKITEDLTLLCVKNNSNIYTIKEIQPVYINSTPFFSNLNFTNTLQQSNKTLFWCLKKTSLKKGFRGGAAHALVGTGTS